MDLFDVGPAAAISVVIAAGIILSFAVVFFIHSAPPTQITISTGPAGGGFEKFAQAYAKVLQENGVKVKLENSQGSNQNLIRLKDKSSHVDVAMVQAGIATGDTSDLISLGSISQQPVLIFYRGKAMTLLSELKHKRIAIGPDGSGANQLATAILALNGIKTEADAVMLPLSAEEAYEAMQKKQIDAAFIMSESASINILKGLVREKDVRLYSFTQQTGYVRKLTYLNALTLPAGVIDMGVNLPKKDVALVGPTIELVATKSLHPALSDLLLDAATQVHSKPGIFQFRGEFPAPQEHDIKISDDANRYYKSGKSFFYRYLPYWLASLLSRILTVFLPAVVILIPAIKAILGFFRWRVRVKIYQRYKELLTLERELHAESDPVKQARLRENFDRIEEATSKMRVKGSYANEIYGLRGHIDYVRRLVAEKQKLA